MEYRLIYGGQLAPVAKVDGSGNILETYIYGLGVNSPDYILKDGTKYRVIKDHLGSIRMITNSSTGEVVKTISYSEFGEITSEIGTFDTLFGFAGGISDTDTSLTKFGARWYDSTTGRWIEKEPLGFEGSDNFYSYCDGDPVNWVDITGKKISILKLTIQGLALYAAYGIILSINDAIKLYDKLQNKLDKECEKEAKEKVFAAECGSTEEKNLLQEKYENECKTKAKNDFISDLLSEVAENFEPTIINIIRKSLGY